MSVAIVLLVVLAILFALAYLTKRRFGVLGLALAAGSVLSTLWSHDLTPLIYQAGVNLVLPPLDTVVAAALVLLPAIVLFFSGPTYKDVPRRLIGALAFALLALAFLLPILGDALVLTGDSRKVYDFIAEYRVWIVTGGLIFALFDLLATKTPKHKEKE
jgi:hypothetical protein